MNNAKQRVISFLNSIGIRTVEGRASTTGFLPNIKVRRGILFYNHKTNAADLLHNAGHIAVIPAKYRLLCTGNMEKAVQKIWRIAEKTNDDSSVFRALMQASETEAIAWSWAVGKHLGLRGKEIITDDKSHFKGIGADIRAMLKANCYFGINGLREAGMVESVKTFPRLTRWTQA